MPTERADALIRQALTEGNSNLRLTPIDGDDCELCLRKMRDGVCPSSRCGGAQFNITHPEHGNVGYVAGQMSHRPGVFRLDQVHMYDGTPLSATAGGRQGVLGAAAMRDLGRQLRRLTGARQVFSASRRSHRSDGSIGFERRTPVITLPETADQLIRAALTEGKVRPFIRSKVVRHIEAPMTQMLLGEPQVKQMAAALSRHGFTHDSSMALNSKIAHHKFKRGHRLITVTRFKEPEGNRVVWSSAGLTGHGQDGRGEHYTTLTTHLRAITPRRVHEEASSRFKVEPAPNSGIPPDFADYQNRAWISPEGKVHALKQGTPEEPWRGDTHGGWAMGNQHVHGEHGDLWTMFDNMQAKGWVRKTAKDFYDIGPYNENSIATVHKHFTTHHPELDSVRVYSRENSGTLHRLHKDLNEEAGDGRQRFITEPSLDDIPSDWAEMHNRAWISPEGEVHHLQQHHTTPWLSQTHFDWAKQNQELHGFKSSTNPFTIPAKLLQNGWIRTTTKNYYHVHKADQATLATVHKHFTTHHPELRKVTVHADDGTMLTLHKRLRDPAAEKAKADEIARQLKQESEHSWKDEFGELGDFAEPQHRAWISPEGKVHPLGRDGQETHGGWIARVRSPDVASYAPEYESMTKAGWVRKVNPNRYSGAKHAVKNALAHVRQHHPEVGRILFTAVDQSPYPYREYVIDTKTGAGVKRGLRKPMSESEVGFARKVDFDARPRPGISCDFEDAKNRAWISPKGEVHKLEKSRPGDPWDHFPTKTHYTKASEILGNGSSAGATQQYNDFQDLLGGGWVRKVSRTTYEARDPHQVAALVHQHLVKHHPDVEAAIIQGPKGAYTFVSKNGEVYA